jgi:hypothetical protein
MQQTDRDRLQQEAHNFTVILSDREAEARTLRDALEQIAALTENYRWPTATCEKVRNIARAALATPDTEWRRQQIDRLVDEGHDEDMAARLVDFLESPAPLGATPDTTQASDGTDS